MQQPPQAPPPDGGAGDNFRAMVPAPLPLPPADPLVNRLTVYGVPGVLLLAVYSLGFSWLLASPAVLAAVPVLLALAVSISAAWLGGKRSTWTLQRRLGYGALVGVATVGYALLLATLLAGVVALVYVGFAVASCVNHPGGGGGGGGCH